MNYVETLASILALVKRERSARDSSLWKSDMDVAFHKHGDAIDALFAELYRLLDEQEGSTGPVKAARPQTETEIKREITKRIIQALKEDLPDMVSNIIDAI